jgi:glyoxylase-like metal-dependent hydrolase (beta-lactamase superfamily II)
VLPAHAYQLRLWDRKLPPVSGRPSDREYLADQLDAVNGILAGTILGESYIPAGRQLTWARSKSAQVVFRLDTIYAGGPFGGNYGPDIWRVVKIPGPYKTSPWIDSSSPIANIKTEFYLLRDNANTSVYIIKGSRRTLVVGTGRGTKGLATIAKKIAGKLPIDVVITSDDPEQIGGVSQFGSQKIFVAKGAEIPRNLRKQVKEIPPGYVFDLGRDADGRPARVEAIPLIGHSKLGLTLLSVSDRILLSGDALGEQFNGGGLILTVPPAEFDVAFREWRTKTDGRYDSVYTAHNYTWFTSPVFVDKVQEALGIALAGGPTVPSVRPAGFQMVQSSGPGDVIASIILPPA